MSTRTNERPGVRAKLSDARFSAWKAREVLDLVRGEAVGDARNILELCDRAAAEPIAKLLDSAVANAGNNNDIPPEELYVGACYADEGPTLKRWRPRARGRATRINKRTCHITVIVGRYSAEEMDERRGRGGDASAERARRVARSRAAQEEAEDEETAAAGQGPRSAEEAGAVEDPGARREEEAEIEEIEDEAMAVAEADTDDAVVEEAAEEAAAEVEEVSEEAEEADEAAEAASGDSEDDTEEKN
jgi:large subunit ribosomal protein L22